MNTIKCLIVEDEELARDLLENFISKLPHLELVEKCENPLKAMPVLMETSIDLIFLDIQMPELTGVEFLKMLPNRPTVIFTTAYPSYALEGYQLNVTDYLLKPFSFERFMQAVNKASEVIRLKSLDKSNGTLTIREEGTKDYMLIKSEHKVLKVKYENIRYIESMREYAAYHTTTHGRILSLKSLKQLEKELPTKDFIRIHKSYIVNISKIEALEGNRVQLGKDMLPIGASYKEMVLEKIF